MAWSIFDQPNGNLLATAWAVELLQAIGAPANPSTLQMVFDWEASEGGGGKYNPLNQGPVPDNPALTSTGEQYGGGAADFVSWEAGLAGAVAYLTMPNYSAVKNALVSGDGHAAAQALWQSPWAASHYGYGANWSSRPYVQASPTELAQAAQAAGFQTGIAANAGQIGGQSQGGIVGATGGTGDQLPGASGAGSAGTGLSMSDIPAVDSYIRQNFGSDAWLLDIPQVKQVLEQDAVNGLDSTRMLADVQQTDWWKTTSAAVRQFDEDQATNPADYSFTAPGSKASQSLIGIQTAAAKNGVQLDQSTAQTLALDALKYGWNDAQMQAAIGAHVNSQNAPTVYKQLQAAAGQYLLNVSPQTLQSWATNIAGGTQTMDQFAAYLSQNAKVKWSGMAPMIDQGLTPNQIVDSYRQEAARTMEVDPNSIDFVNNPIYSKILDYVPPGQTGNTPEDVQHRMMTQSEMDQYLKTQPSYQYTQGARNSGSAVSQAILQTWGKT